MRFPLVVSPLLRRVLVTLAVVALIAARKHDSFSNPQFWAEDGAIFFIDAETVGWSAFAKPYEGYLHFLPRVAAGVGQYLPLISVPVFYAVAALLATGWIAWAIQSPRLKIPAAWAGALAIGLIPHRGEVYLTLCNLQWITAIGLFALPAMEDARTRAERVGDIALLIATALTGPFVILALPLFAWRAWRLRSRWSYWLLGIVAACALAHVPSLLARPASTIAEPWHPLQHAAVIGQRVWTRFFSGPRLVAPALSATVTLALTLALGAGLWWRREKLQNAWILFFAMLVVLAATAYKARIDTWNPAEPLNGDRYFFAVEVLALWLLAALLVTLGIFGRIAAVVILFVPVAANFSLFVYPPFPDQHWAKYAHELEDGKPTMVPILPSGFKFWHPGRH
jgi:hypothetical protein